MLSKQELEWGRVARVVKANDLIRKARYDLPVAEQRLVLFLVSKIKPGCTELPVIRFTLKDYFRIVGIKGGGSSYEAAKETILSLANKGFWLTAGKTSYLCRWIERARVDDGEVVIHLCQDMKPFLLELLKNFTVYELCWVLRFKSRYSLRLFEILRSYKFANLQDTFTIELQVDALRDMLGTIHYDKQGRVCGQDYVRYIDFKRFCIMQAVKEINESSDMTVTIEEKKKGRRIVSLKFTIGLKDEVTRLTMFNKINEDLNIKAGEVT